ncbi:MAG: 2Fe-2S iron-sulfur cluster-binding protein, partial [Woeseiaceae bacterium]
MSSETVNFELNGEPVSISPSSGRRFSRVLREDFGLTGTKVGCNAGDCGACTILVDSKTVCACMMSAQQAAGHSIETVEGLANGHSSTNGRLQQSFLQQGAAQCGICTPGMLVAAEALLRKYPHPNEQQVEDAIGGVLCRCTGYRKIVSAIMNANTSQTGERPTAGNTADGEPIVRLVGTPKVTGNDLFAADAWPADALLVRAIRSPHPRAAFSFGDIGDYVDKSPGVIAVYTAKDVPGRNCFGVIPEFVDQPVFAETEARFEGEAVALVVGAADMVHDLDLSSFPVAWNELPQVMTSANAADEHAPQLHPGRPRNRLTGGFVQTGDLDTGFDAADAVVEGTFTTGFIEHAYVEPEAGFARRV